MRNLIPIADHCVFLVTALANTRHIVEWENVADWLQLASSVKSIDIDVIQHDLGFGYCSAADEYSMSRETLLKEFVTALVVFQFVWGGLESALNVINLPGRCGTRRGKISDACFYLGGDFQGKSSLPHLHEEALNFRSAAQECFGYHRVEERFARATEYGAGAGLFGVYELRNAFAHGSMEFPEPDEENRPISAHAGMVRHATRVTLISLQMLLLAYFRESDELVLIQWQTSLLEEYPLSAVLRECHMAIEDDKAQLFG